MGGTSTDISLIAAGHASLSADGMLARLLKEKKAPEAIVEELFVATFGRGPNADERKRIAAAAKGKPLDESILKDLFWALLNSKEFVFNH